MVVASVLVAVFAITGILYYALRSLPHTPMPTEPLPDLGLGAAAATAAGSPDEPRCGGCGYIVLGLESMTCPECGEDLRRVGIDAGQRRGAGVGRGLSNGAIAFVIVVGWSVLVWTAARSAGNWLERHGPRVRTVNFNAVLSGPRSGAYDAIKVTGAGERSGTDGRMPSKLLDAQQVALTVVGSGGVGGTMTIDLEADRYTTEFLGAGGRTTGSGAGLSAAAVGTFVARAAGKDGRPPADRGPIDAEAREVVALMLRPPSQHQAITGSSGGSVSGSSGNYGGNESESMNWSTQSADGPFALASGDYQTTRRMPAGREAYAAVGGLAVWAAGVWWVARRSRAGRR
ncbi:MAG TPA: hypothetical protein VF796_16685 [Humisphaera sp.]